MTKPHEGKQPTPSEDDVLRRMLNTPPKPHAPAKSPTPEKKK